MNFQWKKGQQGRGGGTRFSVHLFVFRITPLTERLMMLPRVRAPFRETCYSYPWTRSELKFSSVKSWTAEIRILLDRRIVSCHRRNNRKRVGAASEKKRARRGDSRGKRERNNTGSSRLVLQKTRNIVLQCKQHQTHSAFHFASGPARRRSSSPRLVVPRFSPYHSSLCLPAGKCVSLGCPKCLDEAAHVRASTRFDDYQEQSFR